MSNKQDMATVYYLGGLKNDLSNLWNSLLNITNLANACVSANENIDNYELPASGNIHSIDWSVDSNADLSGFVVSDYIQLSQATGGQGAIYYVDTVDYILNTISFTQVYGGLNYIVTDTNDTNDETNGTVTVQTNGRGNTDALEISITGVGLIDVNINLATEAASFRADEVVEKLRYVNGASTSSDYVATLQDTKELDKATTGWKYGIENCLQSLMLSMTDTEPYYYDSDLNATKIIIDPGDSNNPEYKLSSASVAPYMFNAAGSTTQVGIMMKNKALGDYGDFLQNNARAWNMLLANLTYGPTTMFNINNVSPFINQMSTLSNSINAFCNELDILYVQVRSGTYSVATNASNLQTAYQQIVTEVELTVTALNTLRTALVD